ncbi:MAG: pyruvate kinase alpha/beta domain-containing protein, partial [Candidatus Competibacteraceae bacterium]|nr:pyruvate kinase alpha/beta domain-containing protein [Candidatus Competibacteraceae bacterium]
DIRVAQRLSLVWGVHTVHTAMVEHVHEVVDKACQIAVEEGFAQPGQALAITAGQPFGTSGTTNLMRIAWI